MTLKAEHVKTALVGLSESDRAELAHFLINSLERAEDDKATTEWEVELERRAEDIHSRREAGEDAFIVLSELRAKYQ